MKERKKATFAIISLTICVILLILGINTIIGCLLDRNKARLTMGTLLFIDIKNLFAIIIGFIYGVVKPNFLTFITGIIMIVIGIVGTFIPIIYINEHFSLNLENPKELKLLIFLFIFFIILLIIGLATESNIDAQRARADLLLFVSIMNDSKHYTIILLLYLGFKPYFITFINGIAMILVGCVGVLSLLINYSKKIRSKIENYTNKLLEGKRNSKYRVKRRKKIVISKCPACHAPLRKKPPCECEYCGAILE